MPHTHDHPALHSQTAETLEAAAQIAARGQPAGRAVADVDFWRGKPFAVRLGTATGLVRVGMDNAAGLRRLNDRPLLPLLMNGQVRVV